MSADNLPRPATPSRHSVIESVREMIDGADHDQCVVETSRVRELLAVAQMAVNHPDHGGDRDDFDAVMAAREAT